MSGFSREEKSLQYLSQYSLKNEMSLRKIEEEKCLKIMGYSLSYLSRVFSRALSDREEVPCDN
jgi:hypothetical protein